MSRQVLSDQAFGVHAFSGLLRAQSALTRRLSAELLSDHGLTVSDYEVLVRLYRAPDRRMRRVDLANQVYLSPSGITRLLDGLESAGLVERMDCPGDRRVVYAALTGEGVRRFEQARKSHLAQIESAFAERLPAADIARLAELLHRLADGTPSAPCEG